MRRRRKHWDTAEQAALRREFAKLYKASGWNQVQCATQLNMTQGYVSKILNHEVALEPATISHFKIKLADVLPDVLRENGEKSSSGEGTYGEPMSEELAELKESFAALVRNEPEKALSLTGVISYLRWGKKSKRKKE